MNGYTESAYSKMGLSPIRTLPVRTPITRRTPTRRVIDRENGASPIDNINDGTGRIGGPKIDINMDNEGKSQMQLGEEKLNEMWGSFLNRQMDAGKKQLDQEQAKRDQFLKSRGMFGQKAEMTPYLRGKYEGQQSRQASSDVAKEAAAYRNASRGF